MFASALKYLALSMLVSGNTWASEDSHKKLPKACPGNSTTLKLTKRSSPLIAVLKCLDANEKEVVSCKLGANCESWIYEVYFNKEYKSDVNKSELSNYELLQKSYPITGDKPKIRVKNDIVSIESKYGAGSKVEETLKYRLEDDKLKLIGIEYSIGYNSQLVQDEDTPYASDFSVNTVTEKVFQTDHFLGSETKKMTCKMNPIFKNLTLGDLVRTGPDSLECTD